MKKRLFAFSALAVLAMTACGSTGGDEPTPGPQGPEEAIVFVLSGQSNMEGNTSFQSGTTDLIAQAFEEMGLDDPEVCTEGMPEVKLSSYCAGYGELNHNKLNDNNQVSSTNKTNRFEGEFVPCKAGYGTGTRNNKMGPEVGLAYKLRDYASEEKPIYLIKMASNGSGFAQGGTEYNWPMKNANGEFPEINLYNTFAKPFIENNLKLIEEDGFKPVIRGWVWHQGESDSDGGQKTANYAARLGDMVGQFREDFADYAVDEDGSNIAFLDGMICESSSWTKPQDMNAAKRAFAESDDMNFLVDTYGNDEAIPANELKTGNPGGDSMHYNTKSSLRLGMAYAQLIIDNDLLEI